MSDAARQALDEVAADARACQKCPLATTRTRAVPGEGPPDAEILFIGEGPGYHEDRQGRPFVGPSGRFLDELLASIGLRRDQVFITNVVKCRPPNNRDPAPDEIAACAPYLERQMAALTPRLIVTLGRYSMARFLPGKKISQIHGQAQRAGERVIFPLFHPAAALHQQALLETVRQDFLKLPALLEELRTAGSPAQVEEDEGPAQLSLF